MPEDTVMTDLTVLPNHCEFDATGSARSIADWADRLIREKTCAHVARAQLLPNDGMAYAVLDARCFDRTRNCYRCSKRASDALFLFAWRFSSSTRTLKSRMTIDGSPRNSVRIRGKSGEPGSQVVEEFVLHPSSSQDPIPDWRDSYAVSFMQSDKTVTASIDISFSVRLDRPKWNVADSLDLAVTVPPLLTAHTTDSGSDPGLMRSSTQESMRSMDGMTAVVIGESIKLLLKDGWEFFKNVASDGLQGGNELVQLNIGKLTIPPESPVKIIEETVRKSDIAVSPIRLDELKGLNSELHGISILVKNLRSNLLETTTKSDKADLETKIEINSHRMADLQQRIWTILRETGDFSLTPKDRQAG